MVTPWLVYGQTVLPANNTDNPTPNVNGLIGEVASLPYTVPAGKVLVIERLTLESYQDTAILAMFLYFGSVTPVTNAMCSATLGANGGTSQMTVGWHIPAGTVVNLRLQNVQPNHLGWTYGWSIEGRLDMA